MHLDFESVRVIVAKAVGVDPEDLNREFTDRHAKAFDLTCRVIGCRIGASPVSQARYPIITRRSDGQLYAMTELKVRAALNGDDDQPVGAGWSLSLASDGVEDEREDS